MYLPELVTTLICLKRHKSFNYNYIQKIMKNKFSQGKPSNVNINYIQTHIP